MLKLYGFSSSNYYNVIKQMLLHKEVEFEAITVYPGAGDEYLAKSPLGKVPCIETEFGFLSETTAIIEYIERAYPNKPLYPKDAFASAKVSEMMKVAELYLELPARALLPSLFMQLEISDEKKNGAKLVLDKGVKGLAQLASFSPYVAGNELTIADFYIRSVMAVTSKIGHSVYNWDIAADISTMPEWLQLMADTDISRTIDADFVEDYPNFTAALMELAKKQ